MYTYILYSELYVLDVQLGLNGFMWLPPQKKSN